MQLKVKQMILDHFKGYENKEITLGNRTFVKGKNGLGKTTIVDAHDWLWFGKDSNLASNIDVVPTRDGVKDYENLVKVTEVIDIDGREVTVTKIQKNTVSKKADANGNHKLTTTNSYEVNCIPKNEKEFKAYFEDLGINFDELIACSHIDVFLNQKQADMRKTLFAMATGRSDLEICSSKKNLAQLKGLLEKGYNTDEIKAMNDSKLKQADKELNGIEPKISENKRQLVDVDVEGLTSAKDGILKVIADYESQLNDVSSQASVINDLQAEIMQVKLDMGECERKANLSLVERKREIQKKRNDLSEKTEIINCKHNSLVRELKQAESDLKYNESDYSVYVEQYKYWKSQTFDESTLICPTCGQGLPHEKAEELRNSFEEKKRYQMEKYKTDGLNVDKKVKELKQSITELKEKISQNDNELNSLQEPIEKLDSEYESLPQSVEMTDNEEYISLQKKLSELQQKASETPSNDEQKATIRSAMQSSRETLSAIERQLMQVDRNNEIQARINELEESRVALAQQKSDCEMILDQLKELSKEKNSLLADEINSKFDKVKWQLFDFQKDGSYKEVCIPMLDGFTFDKMNGARRVTAKIDIIAGLQRFYGINVPLFIDEMESVNMENVPHTDFQLVAMKVIDKIYKADNDGNIIKDELGKPIVIDDGHMRVEVEQ